MSWSSPGAAGFFDGVSAELRLIGIRKAVEILHVDSTASVRGPDPLVCILPHTF